MARSRTEAAGRRLGPVALPDRLLPATALLAVVLLAVVLLAVVLLTAGRGDGAAADPAPPEPIPAAGVAPGSGTLTPEGHRETDTDLDTWVAPDATSGAWYAFPLPSGFAAVEPPEGTELLIRSVRGQARTVLSVTRLPQEGRLGLELAAAAVSQGGRQLLGEARWRTLDGMPAVTVDALDARAEPIMTVRQLLVDIGAERLVLTVTTDADPAEAELGLIETVVVDNLTTLVLD